MTSTRFTRVRVCCYGEQTIRMLAAFTCLWPGVFGARKVQAVWGGPGRNRTQRAVEHTVPFGLCA